MMKKLFLYAFLFCNLLATAQIQIPERPAKIPFIIDSTYTLTLDEQSILNNKLKNYCQSTSTEILVMIVSSTNGHNIDAYAKELGQQWGIGKLGKDNGMVMLIAKNDRKMSIQNGHGIEPILSNKKTKQIIDADITPHFKNGNFFLGISQGLNAVFDVLKTEFSNEKGEESIKNFMVVEAPSKSQTQTANERYDLEQAEKEKNHENISFVLAILVGLGFIALVIIAIVRAANGKGQSANNYSGGEYSTMGRYGVRNHFHNNNRVLNNNNFYSSNNNSGNSGSSWGGSSSSSSGSSSSSSSGSSRSGSGGTFGGGGASGGW